MGVSPHSISQACKDRQPKAVRDAIAKSVGNPIAALTSKELRAQRDARLEKSLQKQVRAELARYESEGRLYVDYDGMHKRPTGRVGKADFRVSVAPFGRWLSIECKSPTGKQRPEQLEDMRKVLATGASYIVARSLDEVIEEVRKLEKSVLTPDFNPDKYHPKP